VIENIPSEEVFINLCKKRSVFTKEGLAHQWNLNKNIRPFIMNFFYIYSLPKRVTRKDLIEMGVLTNDNKGPRPFTRVSKENLKDILKASNSDESIVVD
jgi:hypothetical protein